MNYQNTYNHHIPQRTLNHLSPVETLQNWRDKSPELFVKRVYKRAELDTTGWPAPFFLSCLCGSERCWRCWRGIRQFLSCLCGSEPLVFPVRAGVKFLSCLCGSERP